MKKSLTSLLAPLLTHPAWRFAWPCAWRAALLGVMMTGVLAAAKTPARTPDTVLVAHPVIASLAETLVAKTTIKIVRVAPENLPTTRWQTYFSGRGAAVLAREARHADAVLTLRSLWPDDPLYPLARRANLRIVEIDAARPIDGALPGIALQTTANTTPALPAQPWFDPANLIRMADIVASDLQRLVPTARDTLAANLAAFKQHWVSLSAQAEQALAQAPSLSVIELSDRLDYLVSALNLEAVSFKQYSNQWDSASTEQLIGALQEYEALAVLHHEALPEALQQALRQAAPQAALLTLAPATRLSDIEKTLKQVVQALSAA